MRYFNVLRMLLVVVPLLSISTQASAQNHQIAVAGETRIGMIGGVAYAATNPSGANESCTYLNLGAGGLIDDTVIVGVDQGNNIVSFVRDAQEDWCGQYMQPLITNGHSVSVYGGDSTDAMWGHHTGLGEGRLYGLGGFDLLISGSHGGQQRMQGGPGTDVLITFKPFTELRGSWDDDYLCNFTDSLISEMDGGPGTDSHCGTAHTFINIEQPDCNTCNAMGEWAVTIFFPR